MSKKKLIDRHPWFPFLLAFVALITAWSSMIVIALKHRPETVPLEHVQSPATPDESSPKAN